MRSKIVILILALGGFPLSGDESTANVDPGLEVFRDQCMACHLQTGLGIREMNAPSIAGLPRWYVADQLRKFRRDERGFHSEDAPGKLMQANAFVLDERSIAFVGRHIESLAPNSNRNTMATQSSEASEKLYAENCAQCHGEKGEGARSQRVPPLTSQQDWYLLKQIENFQTGKREHLGYIPSTELSDAQLRAIVTWITELPARAD